MSKRILIFSTAYFPFVGGAEIAIKELTDRLSNEFEFELITARLNKNLPSIEKIGAATIHRIGIGVPFLDKFFLPYFGALKALRLNKKNQYIAFWCIMVSFASGAAYIANWFQKKVPIILTLQEGDSEDWLQYRWFGLINLSWRFALARTNILTTISNYLLERAKKLDFKGKAVLIPNGVDYAKFSHLAVKPPSGEVQLITTSRLVEKNGLEDIINAIKLLPESVSLQIIGSGPLEENLKFKIKNLKLENRVEMLGEIPNSDISLYLSKADIFVRPSLSEGQGISFIEAMAAGLPVIATSVGGIPDFLKDRETGLFCNVNDPKSIAEKVLEYINDPELTKKVVENARKMVEEKYDWDLISRDMKSRVFDTI